VINRVSSWNPLLWQKQGCFCWPWPGTVHGPHMAWKTTHIELPHRADLVSIFVGLLSAVEGADVQASTADNATTMSLESINYWTLALTESVQRRLNRLRCRLGCGLAWAESFDSAGYRSYCGRVFKGQMTQPTVSKTEGSSSPKDRLQSHQVHLTMLQYYTIHMHAITDIQKWI